MSECLERAERLEAAKEYLEKEVHRAHLMHDRDKLADLGHFHEAIQQVEQLEAENEKLKNKVNLMAEDLRTRDFDEPKF